MSPTLFRQYLFPVAVRTQSLRDASPGSESSPSSIGRPSIGFSMFTRERAFNLDTSIVCKFPDIKELQQTSPCESQSSSVCDKSPASVFVISIPYDAEATYDLRAGSCTCEACVKETPA